MKLKFLLFFALLVASKTFFAQEAEANKKGYQYNNNFDLAFSKNVDQSSVSLAWAKFYSVSKKEKFKIGYGIRYTYQSGKNTNFVTAPAKLTSKTSGPQVLFSKTHEENIDTFLVSKYQNNSFNATINIQYSILSNFDIGFNIDAIGFSFGNKVNGKYISQQSDQNNTSQIAKPTSFNLLLVSDNDLGSLNSEIYARYWIKSKWSIKAGASFLFTEYTTENKLRLENDRWRNKSLMALVGVTFSPFK